MKNSLNKGAAQSGLATAAPGSFAWLSLAVDALLIDHLEDFAQLIKRFSIQSSQRSESTVILQGTINVEHRLLSIESSN